MSVRFGLLPFGVVKLTGTGTSSSSNLPASIAAMAFLWLCDRELVLHLARDVEALRQALGGEAHREIRVGIVRYQPGIGRNFIAAHGNHGHGLDAAGDDGLRAARHDALGRHGNRLQAGGAEAIDGHGRDFDGQTGAQRSDARDVHALLGFGHGAAQDHVLDLFGIELRHALQRAFDGHRGQIVGTRRPQSSFISLADRRPDGTYDYNVTHD